MRGWVWLAGYLGTIVGANWLVATVGVVRVAPGPFGLSAPAGVYLIGLGFLLENLVTETLGRRWTLIAIVAGVALSFLITPHFAAASGLSFLCSEMLDFAVFVRVRRRLELVGAALAGDVASDVLDSVVFLWLAFGSLELLGGQLVGKWSMTLCGVAAVWLIRRGRGARGARAVAPAAG